MRSARTTVVGLLVLLATPCAAQTTGSDRSGLSGYVLEAGSDEPLPGASVYVPSVGTGTTTNAYGFFSLTVTAPDTSTVVVSYVGFTPVRRTLQELLAGAVDGAITVRLQPATLSTEGAEVTAQAELPALMGSHVIPVAEAERLPTILGEVDLVRVQQLLPGVRGGTEGTAGLYVRGGSPDQTLILLDGAPVYNASHLFGFFSTFNPGAVKRVELIKGSLPARYGGRLSSVLSVQMREGDAGGVSGEGSVGLAASHVTVEGPLSDRATFALSARRTYLDLLLRPFQPDSQRAGYAFDDLNAKASVALSGRDRVLVGFYTGRDAFTSSSETVGYRRDGELAWGNVTGTARWTRQIGARAFAETSVLTSAYRLGVDSRYEDGAGDSAVVYRSDYRSGLRDLGGAFRLEVSGRHVGAARLGAEATRHVYRPGAVVTTGGGALAGDPDDTAGSTDRRAWEGALYGEVDVRPVCPLQVNAGVRATAFASGGQAYGSVEPRVAARLALTGRLSASASFAAATQYVHLLANSGLGLPTDLWLPSTPTVRPERGWQAAVGLAADVGRGVDLTVEGYYKPMRGLLEYRDGAGFFNTAFDDWERQVVQGRGRAYGAEVLLQRAAGRTTGWLAYTLSRTERQFDALNGGAWYPYRFDRRHDVSVVVVHRARAGLDLSATWVYGTGDAVTLPVGRAPAFEFAPGQSPVYPPGDALGDDIEVNSARNQFRMPATHRLDVSASFHRRVRWGERTLTLGLYNAYNRSNPAYVDIERTYRTVEVYDPEVGGTTVRVPTGARVTQHGLLPTIPAVSYRVRF